MLVSTLMIRIPCVVPFLAALFLTATAALSVMATSLSSFAETVATPPAAPARFTPSASAEPSTAICADFFAARQGQAAQARVGGHSAPSPLRRLLALAELFKIQVSNLLFNRVGARLQKADLKHWQHEKKLWGKTALEFRAWSLDAPDARLAPALAAFSVYFQEQALKNALDERAGAKNAKLYDKEFVDQRLDSALDYFLETLRASPLDGPIVAPIVATESTQAWFSDLARRNLEGRDDAEKRAWARAEIGFWKEQMSIAQAEILGRQAAGSAVQLRDYLEYIAVLISDAKIALLEAGLDLLADKDAAPSPGAYLESSEMLRAVLFAIDQAAGRP